MCNNYNVKKVGSIETYWRRIPQLFIKLEGRRMDPAVLSHVHNVKVTKQRLQVFTDLALVYPWPVGG